MYSDSIDDAVKGIAFVVIGLGMLFFTAWYIGETPLIYEDRNGNAVVCDVDGKNYTISRPECQEALKHPYAHRNPLIWQGTCDKDGICTPKGTGRE